MQENKKYNNQMEINDLIDDAIANAVARRSFQENALLTVSDEEAAMIAGGTGVIESTRIKVDVKQDITIAGFKPVCPPVKPPIIICPPIKPPIIAGMMVPLDKDIIA